MNSAYNFNLFKEIVSLHKKQIVEHRIESGREKNTSIQFELILIRSSQCKMVHTLVVIGNANK
jgi:hypothetical protein